MNSRRAHQLRKQRTEVAFIPCNAINAGAAYTASPNNPDDSQWWNPGAAKHGVIEGANPNDTFLLFEDNVAPGLAGAAQRVNKTN